MSYVVCPNCGTQILESDTSVSSSAKEPRVDAGAIEELAKEQLEARYAKEIELLKAKLKEKAGQLEEARRIEAELRQRQEELLEKERATTLSVVPTEPSIDPAAIEQLAREKAQARYSKEIELLKAKLKEKGKQLEEARRVEAELRQRQEELLEKQRATTGSVAPEQPQVDSAAIEQLARKEIELLKAKLKEKAGQLEEARRLEMQSREREEELLEKERVLHQDIERLQAKQKKKEWEPAAAEYLSGHEFKHRLEVLMDALSAIKRDLEGERLAMEKVWAKRGKQVQSALQNMAGMYGELQGILGTSFSKVGELELPSGSEW